MQPSSTPALFDATLPSVLEVQDFGDHTRCVDRQGRIRKRVEGYRHRQRAEEYVQAFTEGYHFREVECQDLR